MMIVDFPIPGSPEINVRDPGTRPPPRTRFNSPIPVSIRLVSPEVTCERREGFPAALPPPSVVPFTEAEVPVRLLLSSVFKSICFSSTMEFHAPQIHRPIHFVLSYPHSWQTNIVFPFFAIFLSFLVISCFANICSLKNSTYLL